MKTRLILSLIAPVFLAFGCATRPGGAHAANPLGLGQAVVPLVTAGAGAAIGKSIGGNKGAIIGAAVGAAGGVVGSNATGDWWRNQMEESREQGKREERVKIMNDYWESYATNGGNAPKRSSSDITPRTKTVTYPTGVYDGILYGPREIEAPSE